MELDLFRNYLDELRDFVTFHWGDGNQIGRTLLSHPHLNGAPTEVLLKSESSRDLRKYGVFFTSPDIAKKLISSGERFPASNTASFIDPTCGIGDLLIAAAHRLGPQKDIISTLEQWGKHLYGMDLFPEFILATKLRLVLLAMSYGLPCENQIKSSSELISYFSGIRQGDIYKVDIPLTEYIVLNPPFSSQTTPTNCKWSSGYISHAALILEKCLFASPPGVTVQAILPDVLRAGSRYHQWRLHVEDLAEIQAIEIVGKFAKDVDVQVFIGRFVVSNKRKRVLKGKWWINSDQNDLLTIGDKFIVRVGTLVPHRHKPVGPASPYMTLHDLQPWSSVKKTKVRRQFSGTRFMPPFVVVRRNSKAEEPIRAIGAVVEGIEPIAVENHLIVLLPRDGKVETCHELLVNLKKEETSVWLDNRIRCRHLTTSAVKELLWLE